MLKEGHAISDIEENLLIRDLQVKAYKIPTDKLESDGTLEWDHTTLVLVEVQGADEVGLGYTYADAATAFYIKNTLKEYVVGSSLTDIIGINQKLQQAVRNQGTCGIAMMAVSALDIALWDLKAKILNVPLSELLGKVRDEVLIYGSGGFTSYTEQELKTQFGSWVAEGIRAVKMKVGREPDNDKKRVKHAREVIGDRIELFVDANGAYQVDQAWEQANRFAEQNVTWLEEPVSSDNLESLSYLRKTVPTPVRISAGEYGYHLTYFENLLKAKAVDVLQADATRCGGITGFMKAGFLCEAHHLPFSSHCAPAIHFQACLALPDFYIGEYFHDHVRIEKTLFDGFPRLFQGHLVPDSVRPGLGLEFKHADAEPFKM